MGCALALGTFDGVHIGHQKVLKTAADTENSTAVAFDIPPKCFFNAENIIITDSETKRNLILETGIKTVDYIRFNEVRNMSAYEFLDAVFSKYNPSLISCGFNYKFGCGALGNTELLADYCKRKNVKLSVCESVSVNGETVSSTKIRNCLQNGEIEKANAMLNRKYFLNSAVVHGKALGRTLNFPTVNQMLFDGSVIPAFGVYASNVTACGKTYKAVTNIGNNPTFNGTKITVESFILGFEKDVYGKTVKTELISFIRPEKQFKTKAELISAMESDKKFRESLTY